MDARELHQELYEKLLESELQKQLPAPTREERIHFYGRDALLYANVNTEVSVLLRAILKVQELGYEVKRKEPPCES